MRVNVRATCFAIDEQCQGWAPPVTSTTDDPITPARNAVSGGTQNGKRAASDLLSEHHDFF